jgi:tetratricopeptide (TPR) repeat protein
MLGLITILLTLAAQAAPAALEFPAACSAEAHQRFVQGVIKLHNSAYDEAAELFRAAQQLDPQCVMAVWGEAMSFNHPFWGEQDIAAGRRALAKLGAARSARIAKAVNARERAYLNAVEVLYGEGDKDVRDYGYADAMKKTAFDNPSDYEAAAFYASAILGTIRLTDPDDSKRESAASLLKAILAKYPDHPGALHYLVHAYDDPGHAAQALDAARHYEKVADQNFHALHMPSHIYVQLGMWPDAARSNAAAYTASDRYVVSRKLSLAKRDYHSLDWLQYIDLQLGEYAKAKSRIETVVTSSRQAGVPGMMVLAAEMAARYAVETEQWEVLTPYAPNPRSPKLLLAHGLAAVRKNNLSAARTIVGTLESLVQQSLADGARIRSQQIDILRKELLAEIAFTEKQSEDAERLAMEASQIEVNLKIPSLLEGGPGGAGSVKPAVEFYAEMLLRLNKPAAAADQFKASLKLTPKRALSLLGLARALKAQGDMSAAKDVYRELAGIWMNADSSLAAVQEARSISGATP